MVVGAWAASASALARATPPTAAVVPMRLSDTVQPLAYRLHLVVDPDQARHQGEVEIDLRLHRAIPANGAIRLHAKDLTLGTVQLDIGARRWAGRVTQIDTERIDLHFDTPLPAGAARLSLAFDGQVKSQAVKGLFRQQEAGQWGAFTQFEATGARQAFPLFDEPGWKVPWTLSLTVPEALTVCPTRRCGARPAPAPAANGSISKPHHRCPATCWPSGSAASTWWMPAA